MIQPSRNSSIDSTNLDTSETFTIETNESMFRMLTANVYNDTLAAVVREWSTNAIDACLEAGKTPLFDVHLPTSSELYFSVRDYGTGIAEEKLKDFFVLGRSTKRDSNEYNGTLGIGRMAGLAYTDGFTVDSYYQGKHISYLITFQNGYPTPIHMGTFPTTELDGLHLKVTAQPTDIQRFETTATAIYRYFDHKPTLNKELDISPDPSEYTSTDWFFDTKFAKTYSNYVLMSNVLYAIPRTSGLNDHNFQGLILRCPTGAVSFNPGRESLSMDSATTKYIAARFTQTKNEYETLVYAQLQQESTPLKQILKYEEIHSHSPYSIRQNLSLEKILPITYHRQFSMHHGLMISAIPGTQTKIMNVHARTPADVNRANIQFSRLKNILILDVKTNYTPIYDQFEKPLLILQRRDKEDIDVFKQTAKTWLTAFGVTDFHYASDHQVEATAREAVTKQGLQVCQGYLHGNFTASVDATPDQTYWYVPLKGSRTTLADTTWQAIYKAHQFLPLEDRKPLIGIQKKYLTIAENSSLMLPAQEAIQKALDKHTYIVNTASFRSLRNRASNPPPLIADYYAKKKQYESIAQEPTTIYESQATELESTFTLKKNILLPPATSDEIEKQYPLFWRLTRDYDTDAIAHLDHYLKLKVFYDSLHPSDQQDPST